MSSSESTTCAVVGGGPAGMILGLRRILTDSVPNPSERTRSILGALLSQLTRVTSVVPAHLIGVGLRPERAPDFARRSAGSARPQD